MKMHKNISSIRSVSDRALAFFVALIVFLTVLSTLDNDCMWGDDFAAYISEGIAIAEGRFGQQVAMNSFMHPSPLPKEAVGNDLVYVWGYPLILAMVYKLVGFDTVGFQSVIFYKLPSLVALSLMAALMYRFFRLRFKKVTAFILSILLCLHTCYVAAVSSIYSDIVFLLLSWLCFYLVERLVGADPGAPRSITAFLLGICMWACCSVRLNGSSVIAVAALIQLIHLIKNRRKLDPAAVGLHLLPYGILILLSLIFNYLILLPATSNMSDLGAATWEIIRRNIKNYLLVFRFFFFSFPGLPFPQTFWRPSLFLFIPPLALGLLRSFKKEFPYILYLAGTVLTLLLLPYTQGTRYCFNIFPVLFLLLGYCGEWLYSLIAGRLKPSRRKLLHILGFAAVVLLVFSAVVESFSNNFIYVLQGQDVRGSDSSTAYSAASVEAYRYIQENTAGNSVFAFEKPRALFLNTGRLSFNPSVNNHRLSEADYYLSCNYFSKAQPPLDSCSLSVVWSNGDFTLFSVDT